MAKDVLRVRMRRHVAPVPIVMEFEQDETYELPRWKAEQFIDAGIADAAPGPGRPRLEAAALAAPSRRG